MSYNRIRIVERNMAAKVVPPGLQKLSTMRGVPWNDITGGLDPTGGKGGIIDKFSTGRRRLKENIAQKTGKEAADNSEFEERSQRVADLREKVCVCQFGRQIEILLRQTPV